MARAREGLGDPGGAKGKPRQGRGPQSAAKDSIEAGARKPRPEALPFVLDDLHCFAFATAAAGQNL